MLIGLPGHEGHDQHHNQSSDHEDKTTHGGSLSFVRVTLWSFFAQKLVDLQGVQLLYVERHAYGREYQRRHAWQNELHQGR